ncbi:hypothetical protein LCGC14_0992710, partial [marine sediment metagenome]
AGEDISIQDYIDIDLDSITYNTDGTITERAVRDGITLRPANHEGVMTFSVGLGPEDAYLMGKEVSLILSFDASFIENDLTEQSRTVFITLLDLQITENPSSSTPNELWSIYTNGFSDGPSGISVNEDSSIIQKSAGPLTLGDETEQYGVKVDYIYNTGTDSYELDIESELLKLRDLVDITAVALYGTFEDNPKTFVKGTDWDDSIPLSAIIFLSGDRPDDETEFTVVYKLDFDLGGMYGEVSLDSNTLQSQIEFYFPQGFLVASEDSKSPMFVEYEDIFTSSTSPHQLSYTVINPSLSDFVIYNKEDLDALDSDGEISLSINGGGYLDITFDLDPASFTVIYGVKSQYLLGYGFQKEDKTYSDSTRLMYNDPSRVANMVTSSGGNTQKTDLKDPSLYIDLENSDTETVLEIYTIPLLYAPEANFTYILDDVALDKIKTSTEFNTLKIQTYYVTDGGYSAVISDSFELVLDYSQIQPDLEVDGSYVITFSKDLQSLYEMSESGDLDIYVSISQVGSGLDYLPYIVLEKFDYVCDEHLVEMYDRMPTDLTGSIDIRSVINTPHYFQIFSKPFIPGVFEFYTPFDLIEGSEVTISEDLIYSSLVKLDIDEQQNYGFTYLGSSETIPISSDELYMIKNLALFSNAYDLQEPLYDEGFVNLIYGSGTSVSGDQIYQKEIEMAHSGTSINPPDYWSDITGETAQSWESTFIFSNQFLTTNDISVSGTILYHQLFDLDPIEEDIISFDDINEIFTPESGIQNIQFGIQLSDDISIASFKSLGTPYQYELSVQGFPTGEYIESSIYYQVSAGPGSLIYTGNDPSNNNLEYDVDYTLAYHSNGSKYLLFFIDEVTVGANFADGDNVIMADFWAYYEFNEGSDYIIETDPEDPFSSQIVWDYSYGANPLVWYKMHPDLALDSSFIIYYSSLEWSQMDTSQYIKSVTDTITFQPRVQKNITLYYEEQASTLFSIQRLVPDDQYSEADLFNYIYLYTWDGSDESTRQVAKLSFSPTYIIQDSQTLFEYTIDFAQILTDIGPDVIYSESFVFIETEFDSDELKYSLSSTPFNYDYILDMPPGYYNQYHITVDINNGQTIIHSYDDATFAQYVEKIEDNHIYFKDTAGIALGTTIDISYKMKLQPGVLDSKHFLMVTYPWTNVFQPISEEITIGMRADSSIESRAQYRKVSGGSLITPFEYSLSIDDRYSLYLSYRLNHREYYEERFDINAERYRLEDFVFIYLTPELDNYISELVVDGEAAVAVYYTDLGGNIKFLENHHYNAEPGGNTVTLFTDLHSGIDKNPLTAHNGIDEFYISIVPKTDDIEFNAYKFSYDPRKDIVDTINVENWELNTPTSLDVYPNLDAFYFMDDQQSTFENFVCYGSQISSYLRPTQTLQFDIESEFTGNGDFNDLLTNIRANQFLSIFIEANIDNSESLEKIQVNLLDTNKALIIGNDPILIEDLEMNGFEIKVDLSSVDMSSLVYIEIIPTFRQDGIYHPDNQEGQPNAIGVENFEYLNWDEELTIFENGEKFMAFPLEKVLKIDNPPFAYLFNERLQYLEQPAGVSFSWETYPNAYTQLDEYTLMIPNKYLNPDNPAEELSFKDGDSIVLRYNTPMRKGIGIAIGKMYFQKKPAGYSPTLPSAEALLLNIDDYDDYPTYTDPYNYQIPLELTPFDTEFSNSFKNIKIDIDLLDGQIDPQYIVDNLIEFSDIIFSSPYPNYELTINDVLIRSISDETTDISTTFYERVWQFTELETFISDDDPSDGTGDTYTLQRVKDPLFWGDNKWLDYIMIYDESYNYYEAIATPPSEDNHQLHYVSGSDYFEWNSNFDQFQDYYGYQMKLPLIIEPNSQLSFSYVSQDSWQNPILFEDEDIDISSLEIMFDYETYLTPRFEFWGDTVYEKTTYDYQVIQYYSESFTVYSVSEGSDYTHIFDPEDYSFIDDFTNLQLFKVIGLKPTMETVEIITDGDNTVSFNINTQQIQITDSDGQNGDLNDFDLITVILSYSYGPISSFSEVKLDQSFHDSYISDSEATFYDHLTITYSYSALLGEDLLDQNSDAITSGATSFKYIPFNRNPLVSTANTLNNQDSELYIEFEMFSDPFDVIYEADLDMDGRKDYKQEIDLDKDGIFDIIKYGVEDIENPEEIIWYSIIQDVYTEEVTVDKSIEEEKRTEWFDINDAVFSDYGFNVLLLLSSVLALPILLYTLSTMILPDVDYWAQKSITQETTETQYTKTHYYSIRRDDNMDGFIDTQITYEKSDTVIEYISKDYEKTIIAAKPQNVFQYLGDYIAKNIDAFSGKIPQDPVFNRHLTEDRLDNEDFSALTWVSDGTISTLKNTYRKFTKDTILTHTSEFSQEKITVTDWAEGEIEQTRIYQDLFDTSIKRPTSSPFTIRTSESGQEHSISDNTLSMTTPEDEGWDLETWEENIHQKFDAVTTIYNDGTVRNTNLYEEEYTIEIPGRFNLYNDIYQNNPDIAVKNSRFEVTGVMATPQDGLVYYTSDKDLFKDGNAKTPGNYLYFDSDNNNFYETVYVLGEPVTEYNERSGLSTTVYYVKSIGFNYDGTHDFAPYKHVNREIITQTDFGQLASETPKKFGAFWVVNFRKLRDNSLLFPNDPFDGYEAKDHIFEVYKLAEPSEFNSRFPKLFYEVRHQTYSDAWSIYSSQLVQDIAEQVFMTLTAAAASA